MIYRRPCVTHGNIYPFISALSLRVFGEDITTAARDEAQKKKEIASEQTAPVGGGGEAGDVEHAREESAE